MTDGGEFDQVGETVADRRPVEAGDQLVEIVDADDTVVRIATRREMRAGRLRHRSVFVAVVDDSGRLLIHRRSPLKDIWPGWCDIAVGGVMDVGEDPLDAARREVREEIGIEASELEVIDGGVCRAYDDDDVSLLGRCFLLRSSGPFHFDDGEVVEAWWSTRNAFERLRAHERFLPDSLDLLLPLLAVWR